MADADVFDLISLNADLLQLVDDAHLRRHIRRRHGMAGVPEQIIVTVLDQIAAVDELQLEISIRVDVGEALVHGDGRLRRAAVESRERHVCRLHRRRQGGERAGAGAGRKHGEHPLHRCPPLTRAIAVLVHRARPPAPPPIVSKFAAGRNGVLAVSPNLARLR